MDNEIHILVIEDDADINNLLCQIIRNSGYNPQPAYSGTEGLLYFEQKEWDMVLLDLMIPGKPGETVLQSIREKSDVAVIIISAKEEQLTKVDLLRNGADDYITKPFDSDEVAVRIDVLLRRYKRTPPTSTLTFKDVRMDITAKDLTVNNKKVVLTAREYKIMKLFLSSPKKMFTKENIFESVWDAEYYGDENTVNVHMSHLRTKLSQANPLEEYIETIWGMGYRLKS